jgi:MinD-like ATPase involved in chromosome partitioning or flagellar assembly
MKESEIASMLGAPIIAVIHNDSKIPESLGKSHPVVHAFPRSKVAQDYVRLARTLMGVKDEKKKGLLSISLKKKAKK